MAISETCSCGASIELDRGDEVALLLEWRKSHKCKVSGSADFFSQAATSVESAPDFTDKNLHIGFRGAEFDE
jgi:hypothetical protein